MPVSMDCAAGGYGSDDYGSLRNLGIAGLVMAITLALNYFGKGIVKASAVFIGMVVGYLICIPLGMVDLSAVSNAAWFSFPNIFAYGFHFDWASTLAFMMAIGQASKTELSDKRVGNGVLADGVGSAIAGVFGAGPNTAFSQNVGLITLTKVSIRRVMMLAGIFLVLLGLLPKLSALISIMPSPVLGGAGIILFGLIAAQGVKTLSTVRIGDRELLIISVAFALGIGVTVRPDMLAHLPNALKMIFSSGISTGTLVALLLNIVLVKKKDSHETA